MWSIWNVAVGRYIYQSPCFYASAIVDHWTLWCSTLLWDFLHCFFNSWIYEFIYSCWFFDFLLHFTNYQEDWTIWFQYFFLWLFVWSQT